MAGRLKLLRVRWRAGGQWKGSPMWTYDGEEWFEEGGSEEKRTPETAAIQYDMFLPELQVIEIPRVQPEPVVPFPLP